MKFLFKRADSEIVRRNLKYSKASERKEIQRILREEQNGFCAYTEIYFRNTETVHIEHFYPKTENPKKEDDYFNLYLVIGWINERKAKKIAPFLPITNPYEENLSEKMEYEDGVFSGKDKETQNLIDFLGLNLPELVQDRQKHIANILEVKESCGEDLEFFFEVFTKDKYNLSFLTALEYELGLNLSNVINS